MNPLLKKRALIATTTLAAIAFVAGISLLLSRHQDMNHLRGVIEEEIEAKPDSEKFVEELNQWIYFDKGFAKNKDYFLWPKLGPTPMQLLAKGGDCADKSRLLAAMLKSVDIESTLVMLYGCKTCGPTHTVVEARYNDTHIVADPVYNIVFPDGEGGYHGLEELRDDPTLMIKRLDRLVLERGKTDKIASYEREIESYSFPKTINWEKNIFTQQARNFIALFVDQPFMMQRPHFLEDPKLLLSIFCFGISAILIFFSVLAKHTFRTE